MDRLTLDTLLPLEHRGWDALCASRGGTFYGELMTEDAVMVLVNGLVLDRPAVAESLDESPPWSTYELSHARVVPTGVAAAALLYRASAEREGESFTALMTSHYCVIDDEVRLALYQQTTITHDDPSPSAS